MRLWIGGIPGGPCKKRNVLRTIINSFRRQVFYVTKPQLRNLVIYTDVKNDLKCDNRFLPFWYATETSQSEERANLPP